MNDPRPGGGRPFVPLLGTYGGGAAAATWTAAQEEFYWDRLEKAYALVQTLGAGDRASAEGLFRWIEAEALTRRLSTQWDHLEWLIVETIDAECHGVEHIGRVVEAACTDVADRFGYRERPKTMVTVLGVEADAPWAVGRYGYMVDKYPYDKICVPNRSIHAEATLRDVVSHEYMHVVVLNATQGKAPRWLNEGLAVLAENLGEPGGRQAFASGTAPWLSPHDLEITHLRNRQGEPDPGRTHRAYAQSGWLIYYLVKSLGDASIGRLLTAFANNSAWTELRMRATGQSSADEALREVYGFGERALFDQTLAWLKSS